MAEILVIGDAESRRMIREVLLACMRMGIIVARLGDELAVRHSGIHPSWYRVVIIAHAQLPPCDTSTSVDRLPNPQWHLQDSSTGGLRILNWLVTDTKQLRTPAPHIFMGCHVPIMNSDKDHRGTIASLGGIPFYIDSPAPGDCTADGTLTMAGLIGQLARLA